MDILDNYIKELRDLFDSEAKLRKLVNDFTEEFGKKTSAELDEQEEYFLPRLKERQESIRQKLQEILRNPPHYARHFEKLGTFHGDYNSCYEKAVFIMTKFPTGKSTADNQLKKVITAVQAAVSKAGYVPRIAMERQYHPLLWDNVELYLVGCSKGIAIVEDTYQSELNPNVAMEWGCMRAMGKDVLFLAEKEFAHHRADWSGLSENAFDWGKPVAGINKAVSRWLSPGPGAT